MSIQALIEKPSAGSGVVATESNLDRNLIQKAYEFAKKAHEGQKRVSGDAYLTHLVGVADILDELHMDSVTIATGLLHDILEDTLVTYDELKAEFGEEIANLVDGVTKLSNQQFQDAALRQAESTRKMMVAMAKDVRVILVKLADRTHNMRTLDFLSPERRQKMAQETLDIYAPLAHRLGIAKIKSELEDLCLRYLEPDVYYDLVKKVAMKKAERDKLLANVIESIESNLKTAGIKAEVEGRSKHFTSIYNKMAKQQKNFEDIYDLMAIRILTGTVKECYEVLGMIHTLWKPLPGRFKDYIAMPKNNMYQSLHTTLMGPDAQPIEVQIRTYDMHRTAEEGIAAHWIYKEGRAAEKEDQKFAWMRQLLDLQQDIKDTTEFAEAMKVDLFEDEVFVFTPKGAVKELPKGATALDFAYAVHTDVGTHCMGVKVNGQMVPLRYNLKNGDIVEVLTQSSRTPS
ncbi:MAG TPA: RelA/SpoT family protein, partial [bacterium]|nr:RelA/SpoT family protein [bacterium]